MSARGPSSRSRRPSEKENQRRKWYWVTPRVNIFSQSNFSGLEKDLVAERRAAEIEKAERRERRRLRDEAAEQWNADDNEEEYEYEEPNSEAEADTVVSHIVITCLLLSSLTSG